MKTALITGASSGIGAAFASELASRGVDLVLVARSGDRLQTIATDLRDRFDIRVDVLSKDLSQPDAAGEIFEATQQWELTIDLLINNAGFGDYGPFSDRDRQRQLDMVKVNVLSAVDLTYLFLPGMRQRAEGNIINVSSIAAFQPMPYLSVYGASKAFILSFSEALWAENKPYGIRVLALCPGPTETQFFDRAKFPKSFTQTVPQRVASVDAVVKDALQALNSNAPNLVTGGVLNRVIVNLPRLLPRPMLIGAIASQFKPKSKSADG
ncbi:MAG TPA: SDR family NAD(P)-dependent oxidoreductase [Elainellaceae cyanobacterium]